MGEKKLRTRVWRYDRWKASISRLRLRYENNIKIDFVTIEGDGLNWDHFELDIKYYGRLRL